jgi:hypothetical protein
MAIKYKRFHHDGNYKKLKAILFIDNQFNKLKKQIIICL